MTAHSESPFKSIQVEDVNPEYRHLPLVPVTTLEDCTNFERHRGIRLPKSYILFCTFFGAGALGGSGYYRIAAPMPVQHQFNLEIFHRDAMHSPFGEPYWPEDERGGLHPERTLFVASNGGGDGYAWNLDELTNADETEYRIYELRAMDLPEAIADSYDEYVLRFCLEPHRDGWIREPTFQRFYLDS